MSIITNTTVVSNFAGIGQLDLLRQLFGTIHISAEVYQEIQVGLEKLRRRLRVQFADGPHQELKTIAADTGLDRVAP